MTRWLRLGSLDKYVLEEKNEDIIMAAEVLKQGGLVAFPTETVYGLGAIATDTDAVRAIFKAKGRPSDNPLIIHFGRILDIQNWVADFPPVAKKLADAFWPGPLTIILPHRGNLSPLVTAGLSTVGVRVPDHPIALRLLSYVGLPVAAPSANRSGRPSPTQAIHVWEDLNGRFDLLLDGGATGVGVESTVVDVTTEIPMILRPGGISLEEIQAVIGEAQLDPGLSYAQEKPRSPGMKYRHYAPKATMWLIDGEYPLLLEFMQLKVNEAKSRGLKVGVLITEESRRKVHADVVVVCGSRKSPESVAHNLYHALREFDQKQVDLIFSETFPEKGVYLAIMNRLYKAANGQVLHMNKSIEPDSL